MVHGYCINTSVSSWMGCLCVLVMVNVSDWYFMIFRQYPFSKGDVYVCISALPLSSMPLLPCTCVCVWCVRSCRRRHRRPCYHYHASMCMYYHRRQPYHCYRFMSVIVTVVSLSSSIPPSPSVCSCVVVVVVVNLIIAMCNYVVVIVIVTICSCICVVVLSFLSSAPPLPCAYLCGLLSLLSSTPPLPCVCAYLVAIVIQPYHCHTVALDSCVCVIDHMPLSPRYVYTS